VFDLVRNQDKLSFLQDYVYGIHVKNSANKINVHEIDSYDEYQDDFYKKKK
jgi:hypothetical protein